MLEEDTMKLSGRIVTALFVIAAAHAAPAPAAADTSFGVRIGYYVKAEDPFIGAEALFKLAPRLYLNPNVEAVLVGDGRYITLNGDVHYDLPAGGRNYIWIGAGLAVINVSPEGPAEGHTDLGANFFGGIGRRTGRVIPYAQAKVIAKDDAELVLAVGVRF